MLISVCLATYNGEKYLQKQIESILEQLPVGAELIISDDFSTDGTREVINNFRDARILLVQNEHRVGVIKNFERALKLARGNYIFLSDQDDVWVENKLNIFLNHLKEYDIVVSDAVVVNSTLEVVHPSYFRLMGSKKGLVRNFVKNNYLGCNMAFNRKVLMLALPFPNDIPMHDIWIGTIGELFFKTYFIPNQLNLYRRHSLNVSNTGSYSPFSLVQKIKFRVNLIKYFPLLFARKFSSNKKHH